MAKPPSNITRPKDDRNGDDDDDDNEDEDDDDATYGNLLGIPETILSGRKTRTARSTFSDSESLKLLILRPEEIIPTTLQRSKTQDKKERLKKESMGF